MKFLEVVALLVALLLVAWGWTALFVFGFWRIIRELKRYATGKGFNVKRLGLALLMIAIACAWQRATASLNFGEDVGVVRKSNGQDYATIEKTGFIGYCLHVYSLGEDSSFPLQRRPSEVFWMRGGDAIGVAFRDDVWQLIDVALMAELRSNPFGVYTPAQLERSRIFRKLSPEEIAELKTERPLAEERGELWKDGQWLWR